MDMEKQSHHTSTSSRKPSHHQTPTATTTTTMTNAHEPHSQPRPSTYIRQTLFAGRVGGNQEFVYNDANAHEPSAQSALARQPDAAPLSSFRDALDISGFKNLDYYRMALIEFWGTGLLVFTFGAGASGLTTLTVSPMASALYASLLNTVGLSLFIYSAGPSSGGHLNPSITMSTFFAGLATLPRAVLYIVAQALGAIVGGFWLRLGLGDEFFKADVIPGCTVDEAMVSPGQLFALEFFFAQGLIFTAFGVGLDPRQGKVFGPALAPMLVGLTLGFGTLVSAIARPGYTGVSVSQE